MSAVEALKSSGKEAALGRNRAGASEKRLPKQACKAGLLND
jgi:hypothetical protein